MTAAYPPPGTRVRWTSQAGGKWTTKEGVVVKIGAARAVAVDTIDGQPRRGGDAYYRPLSQWLEIVETPTCG